jgi:hypothetical protein
MFAATQDPLLAQCFVKGARQPNDLFHCLSVAAAAERIVGVVIERNVEDGTEVEVETEKTEEPAGNFTVTPDEGYVVAIPQLLGVRRLVPDQAEPRDASAFLVDRYDRFDGTEIPEIIDQFP